ncbi:hypothetical protein [Methyloceanibacter caenitepidi]|uniref:Uncharacterized protein n=1 Tax=Methyloceanibacter caenitepidi TaxID=1384459 RepID=A0A0A8K733_9HYPH|nr:hypothetical protein [Methyloceanibacter caenitepidi]BAQ18317.1 hypothetical protein GL4_2884 [Methyloceanibacter caenitepidi]
MANTEKEHAVLTLKHAGEWSPEGRKDVANWLREQAASLEQEGDTYASRYRARYLS